MGITNPASKRCGDGTFTSGVNAGIDIELGNVNSLIPISNQPSADALNVYAVSTRTTSDASRGANFVYVARPGANSATSILPFNIITALSPSAPSTLVVCIGALIRTDILPNVTSITVITGSQTMNTPLAAGTVAIGTATGTQQYGLRLTSTTVFSSSVQLAIGAFVSGATLSGISNIVSIAVAVGLEAQGVNKGTSTASNVTASIAARALALNLPGSARNIGFEAGLFSGSTINAAFYVNSNTAGCGAGFVAGTAADVCFYRSAASTWAFNPGTGLLLDGASIANIAIAIQNGNLRLGSPIGTSLATTTTTGMPLIPSVAGTPTGVPQNTSTTSAAALWDRTNRKACFYDTTTSAWVCIGSAGTGTVTSVSGTANQISVATGTTTPVISIPTTFSWSGTSWSLDAATISFLTAAYIGARGVNSVTSTNFLAIQGNFAIRARSTGSFPLSFLDVNVLSAAEVDIGARNSADSADLPIVLKSPIIAVSYTGAAVSTSATDGFFHIPYGNGAPIGVPTLIAGAVPLYFDDSNLQLWVYSRSATAWKHSTTYTLAQQLALASESAWSKVNTPIGAVIVCLSVQMAMFFYISKRLGCTSNYSSSRSCAHRATFEV